MINKTYHTFRTVPHYIGTVPNDVNKTFTFRTYNDLGTVLKVWYVLFTLYLGTVLKVWYVIIKLFLYLGTVLKVWYVLFIIIFRNCSEGVVCLVYPIFRNCYEHKTYHTFITVPKYNDKQDIPHLQNSS